MYLVLKFDSAGLDLTPPSKKTKMDDINIIDGGYDYKDRDIKPIDEILIPKHCAINMLHVLCGLPPVSHNKPNKYFEWNHNIVNAIEQSYIKYNFIPKFDIINREDGSFYYKTQHSEMYQSAKAKINSQAIHSTPIKCPKTKEIIQLQGIHTWAAWRRYLGYELYNEVIKYFEEVTYIQYSSLKRNFDLTDVIALVMNKQGSTYSELANKLKKDGKTAIANILIGEFKNANYNGYHTNYPHNINNGIKQQLVLSGSMLIKISDDMYDMINNNDGVATLLDGGVVSIVDCVEDIDTQDNLSYEGWVKIGSI